MKIGSEGYQYNSEGVQRKVRWICFYYWSLYNCTIGNQEFKLCVWNKWTFHWLALTFLRFMCRSALPLKLWTGKDRQLFDRFWRSDSRLVSDIFPTLWHSSCCTLSFTSSWYSTISLYYLFLWELIKVWKVRWRKMLPDFSPYLSVNSASASDLCLSDHHRSDTTITVQM